MRQSSPTPSLVPNFDVVYVVLDDFGKAGRAYRESDEETSDFESVVENILSGQYNDPRRIYAFNPVEGWSRDVTEEIGKEVERRAESGLRGSAAKFIGHLHA
jgi:hypothetical protein